MSRPTPVVGQWVWLKEFRLRDPRGFMVMVTKVGRKWASISRDYTDPTGIGRLRDAGRFDHTHPSWPVDSGGYSSTSHCWPSREECEAEERRDAALASLRVAMRDRSIPQNVTEQNIIEAMRLLGLGDDAGGGA